MSKDNDHDANNRTIYLVLSLMLVTGSLGLISTIVDKGLGEGVGILAAVVLTINITLAVILGYRAIRR